MISAIESFQQRLDGDFTRPAACGRHYVFVERLHSWLKSPSKSNPSATNASVLVEAAYHIENLLLKLGCGNLIHYFLRKNVVDRDLPTATADPEVIQTLLVEAGIPNAYHIATRFEELRWRFCPVKFELGVGKDYVKERVLPIHKRKVLSLKGGTADVWDIIVPEEFVSDELATVVGASKFYSKEIFTHCYEFALKTFKAESLGLFENERYSFQGLRDHSRMIKYLGDFKHDFSYDTGPQPAQILPPSSSDSSTNLASTVTYNILLEFGELDLEEYFLERLPPFLPSEILSFWEHFFEIAEGISELHNLKLVKNGTIREYHGWHADIKPDNILLVQDRFKLADPGFAVFKSKTDADSDPVAEIQGGTEAYGAPERDRKPEECAYQTIDTWSLGCVFSKTATWMVLGHQGILQFNKLRIQAIKTIRPSGSLQLPRSDDAFHDGIDVLPVVHDWHQVLCSASRGTDHITSKILELVDQKMLLGDPLKRVKTDELCELLQGILKQAGKERHVPIPDTIVETLVQVDKNAESKPTEAMKEAVLSPNLPLAPGWQTRRSKLDNIPLMKTGNRSSLAPPAKPTIPNVPAINVPPDEFYGPRDASQFTFGIADDGNEKEVYEIAHDRDFPSTTAFTKGEAHSKELQHRPQADPVHPNLSSIPFAVPYQNVHQARFELENRKKSTLLSLFRGKKTEENALLGYFKDRDIKFLADNGPTMSQYWAEATNLIDTLMMKVEGLDDNGVDFYVTDNTVTVSNTKSKREIKNAMVRAEPNELPLGTDMNAALGGIFQEHFYEQESNKNYGKTLRKMTLIVLTDGIWSGTPEEDAVENQIVQFVNSMTEIYGVMEVRPCTIQFIQFGEDAHATERLRRLDDDLTVQRLIPDVVDRELSTGNVYKMILGSVHAGMDSLNTGSSAPSTPSSHSESSERSPIPYDTRRAFPPAALPLNQSPVEQDPYRNTSPSRSTTVGSKETIRPSGHRRNKRSIFQILHDKLT